MDKITSEFLITRAKAIQGYASLEQSFCLLFAHLAGTDQHVAAIIFFKITASRSRAEILSKLFRRKYKDKHNLFWNSVQKQAGQLDQRRNSIVHWNVMTNIHIGGPKGQETTGLTLVPPNMWETGATPITRDDLLEFIDRCDVIERTLNIFTLTFSGILPPEPKRDAAWLPIFQQPLAYPLPDTHPLSRNYKEPQTPPQPSEGSGG